MKPTTDATRRSFLVKASLLAGASPLVSLGAAQQTTSLPPKGKAEHCIMIWLGGGSCHIDTWDPKRLGDAKKRTPGSYYKAIETVIPDTQICEHLPRCANVLDRFNILRTVNHGVIDEHAIATNQMHTGRTTTGTITYPSIGSLVAHQRGGANDAVPPYILIGYPNVTRGPGFLGAKHGFVYLTDTDQGPSGLARAAKVNNDRQARREQLLRGLSEKFISRKQLRSIQDYQDVQQQALSLAGPEFMSVFELTKEPASLRSQYGGEFGQRCLLARRLVQSGVRFIEVSHNLNFVNGTGWDTHNEGQLNQHLLIQELDKALSALVQDLESKKILDKTLIVVASEFGRPAGFDAGGGRGHHSKSFSVVLAGGGLKNGITIGTTDELGMKIVDRPISVPDLHATVFWALGIHPNRSVYAGDRPVPLTDHGRPVHELFS